jgi:hypothetical protein
VKPVNWQEVWVSSAGPKELRLEWTILQNRSRQSVRPAADFDLMPQRAARAASQRQFDQRHIAEPRRDNRRQVQFVPAVALWAYGVNTVHVDIIPCGRRIGHQRFVLLVGCGGVSVGIDGAGRSAAIGSRDGRFGVRQTGSIRIRAFMAEVDSMNLGARLAWLVI